MDEDAGIWDGLMREDKLEMSISSGSESDSETSSTRGFIVKAGDGSSKREGEK